MIRALNNCIIKSKLVWEVRTKLDELETNNTLSLRRIPEDTSISGDEGPHTCKSRCYMYDDRVQVQAIRDYLRPEEAQNTRLAAIEVSLRLLRLRKVKVVNEAD